MILDKLSLVMSQETLLHFMAETRKTTLETKVTLHTRFTLLCNRTFAIISACPLIVMNL